MQGPEVSQGLSYLLITGHTRAVMSLFKGDFRSPDSSVPTSIMFSSNVRNACRVFLVLGIDMYVYRVCSKGLRKGGTFRNTIPRDLKVIYPWKSMYVNNPYIGPQSL